MHVNFSDFINDISCVARAKQLVQGNALPFLLLSQFDSVSRAIKFHASVIMASAYPILLSLGVVSSSLFSLGYQPIWAHIYFLPRIVLSE